MDVSARLSLQRDLARAISAVENDPDRPGTVLAEFAARHSRNDAPPAFVVGITGPPGAGKSTLVDRLIERFRTGGDLVAVIAVDPSSPFTRGAVLGDRIRMQRHAADDGVFIRSMASREARGGLAPATGAAIRLAESAGFGVIIVETVGVGQIELEIVSVADAIAVVLVPGLGDEVQTIKAGLTEIADLFIVNMADRPGANRSVAELKSMLHESGREVGVLATTAIDGSGIDDVMTALGAMRGTGPANSVRAVRFEVLREVRDGAVRAASRVLERPEAVAVFEAVEARSLTRAEAAARLIALVRENTTREQGKF
jgi:LAO/AO transport system kinase